MGRQAKAASFQTVKANLYDLSRPELEEVAAMVAGLLDALEDGEGDAGQEKADGPERPHARGHIEYKTINGCGPYAYLRYWSGKTLKSVYMGKRREDGE